MSDDDRHDDVDRGLVNRRAVLGDAWVDQSLAAATGFNADFQSLITRYAWHAIWGRPGLDHETRRLLVLGMTMGLARWEEFELHCRAALEHGVPVDKIRETLMQGAIYCGVPAANTAFKIAGALLEAQAGGDGAAAQAARDALSPRVLSPPSRVAMHHTFSAPQLQIAVQGEGPPVVLSHALGLGIEMWDALALELAKTHTVLRYAHRGHGESAVPPGPYTMDDLVDDAARVVREWGRGPVVWVGLSLGAMVGQGLAIRHPELVGRLVLANTTARYPEAAAATWAARIAAVEQGGMAAVAEGVVERYLHADFRTAHPALAPALKAALLRRDPEGYAATCHAVANVDWLDRLDRIPGARLEIVDEASHLSVAEQPQRFRELVVGFLPA